MLGLAKRPDRRSQYSRAAAAGTRPLLTVILLSPQFSQDYVRDSETARSYGSAVEADLNPRPRSSRRARSRRIGEPRRRRRGPAAARAQRHAKRAITARQSQGACRACSVAAAAHTSRGALHDLGSAQRSGGWLRRVDDADDLRRPAAKAFDDGRPIELPARWDDGREAEREPVGDVAGHRRVRDETSSPSTRRRRVGGEDSPARAREAVRVRCKWGHEASDSGQGGSRWQDGSPAI